MATSELSKPSRKSAFRWYRFLRRFNVIALALVLSWVLVMATGLTFSSLRETVADREIPPSPVQAEVVDTSDGKISIYSSRVPDNSEASRDVRLVAMKTGKVANVADDTNALVFGEQSIEGLGLVALVKTGMREGRPKFDVVFVRFPNLERFVIARDVDSLDATKSLDDRTFSTVIWDGLNDARFVVVDANSGAIEESRKLDFSRSGKTAAKAGLAPSQADTRFAPIAKFQ